MKSVLVNAILVRMQNAMALLEDPNGFMEKLKTTIPSVLYDHMTDLGSNLWAPWRLSRISGPPPKKPKSVIAKKVSADPRRVGF